MRFRAFWTTINEGKNYYYQVPSDKEKRLFDFYSLELLIKLAKASPQDKKDPHHIFRTLEDDSSELTSLLDAEDKLLPVLKQDILAAMLVSMCCEMRHADSSGGIGFLSEKNQPIFKDFIVNLKIFKALEGGHEDFKIDTKRHRMNNGATPGNYEYAARQRTIKVANKIIKKLGIRPVIEMFEEVFRKGKWNHSYGGKAWGNIAKGWLELDAAKSNTDIKTYIDHAYDLQHNTGSVFNKIKEYSKGGNYDWLPAALDKKYDATPWELVDSSSFKTFGRQILQKIKYKRNFIPDDMTVGRKVIYSHSQNSKAQEAGFYLDGREFTILDINPLYGKIKLNNDGKERWVSASKFELVREDEDKLTDEKDAVKTNKAENEKDEFKFIPAKDLIDGPYEIQWATEEEMKKNMPKDPSAGLKISNQIKYQNNFKKSVLGMNILRFRKFTLSTLNSPLCYANTIPPISTLDYHVYDFWFKLKPVEKETKKDSLETKNSDEKVDDGFKIIDPKDFTYGYYYYKWTTEDEIKQIFKSLNPGFTDAATDLVASQLIKDYAIGKQKAEEILAKDVVYCLKSNIAPDKIHITPQANNSSVTFTFPYYFVKLKPALPASKEKSSQQSTNEIDFLKDLDDLIHVYYVVKDTNSIQPPYTSFELKPQYQNKAWNFPLIFGDMQLAVYKLQKSIVFNLKYTPTGNELNLLKRLYAKLLKVDSQNTIEI